MIPWRDGELLVLDATSPDTFAPSYVSRATREPGAVAAVAEDRKRTKYTSKLHLHPNCHCDLRRFWPTDTTANV